MSQALRKGSRRANACITCIIRDHNDNDDNDNDYDNNDYDDNDYDDYDYDDYDYDYDYDDDSTCSTAKQDQPGWLPQSLPAVRRQRL